MKKMSKIFVSGLVTVLPAAATFGILSWLAGASETFLGGILQLILPVGLYRPGMGIVFGIIVMFLVGVIMHAWVARKLVGWTEGLINRIPLVKTVYSSFRDLAAFITGPGGLERPGHQVVMVPLGDTGMEVMGFVTRQDCTAISPEGSSPECVAVYLPMSYQMGGYTVVIPRDSLRPLEMSREQAMRFVLTAGMTAAAPKRP